MNPVFVGSMGVGPGHRCVVIAEAGVNHNGSLDLAHRLVDAAVNAGADIVKFQAFNTGSLVTASSRKAAYQVANTGTEGSQEEMLRDLELSADEHRQLKRHCDEAGIMYMCTPYDVASADMLEEMEVTAFKIASTDATNVSFIRYLGAKGRPLVLSTGMTSLSELDAAMSVVRATPSGDKVILLHCTSAYPAPPVESNLRVISTLGRRFAVPVGFSDHTPGIDVAVLAVAAGASMIEKHLTLDRSVPGPDHRASLEPSELAAMVEGIRRCEDVLGDGNKRITPAELENKNVLQKGLYAARPVRANSVIEQADIAVKRPVNGLPAIEFDRVVGSTAKSDIAADSPITENLLQRRDRT